MKHGVINVYKEAGMTSFQVVYQIRKLTGEKKIGHTGTLDPDATGVLPVCIGKATKLVDSLMDSNKQYRARMLFGKKTDTQDISGTVLENVSDEEVHRILKEMSAGNTFTAEPRAEDGSEAAVYAGAAEDGSEAIYRAMQHFTGEIEQLPPMYSAVKVDGVKLVDAARKGREIERKKRPAQIFGFEEVLISGLENETDPVTVDFTVNCSKGTYIRTLCEDMGTFLGIPACLLRLERTRTSGLDLSSAKRLNEIQEAKESGTLEDLIIPTDAFLTNYPSLTVKDEAIRKLLFGNYLSDKEIEIVEAESPAERNRRKETENLSHGADLLKITERKEIYRVYDKAGNFYALYYRDKRDGWYKCEKMFVEEPDH